MLIFGLVLLIGSAVAIDLSPSTISNNHPGWLIANDGNDHSTITVYVLAGSLATAVRSANVTFSLDSASLDLGTISPAAPADVQTGADGKATAVFTTSKKSGNATIKAKISFYDGETTDVQVVTYQRIDHDTPQVATFDKYPTTLQVGSNTSVKVTLVDRWGNRIDNKNIAETIRLTMDGEGDSGLKDSLNNYVPQNSYYTDSEGNVSADLRISTSVRHNYIQMDPIGNIVVPPSKDIEGVADAGTEPWYIVQTVALTASGKTSLLPAGLDPANAVEIYYTVTDKYDNPITGTSVKCDSTDGKTVSATTNKWGIVAFTFGPKTIGNDTITAVPLGNASTTKGAVCKNTGTIGYCSQSVRYFDDAPIDLTFSGNPRSMASFKPDSPTQAVLQARVINENGDPVFGEMVKFSLETETLTYPGGFYHEMTPPASLPYYPCQWEVGDMQQYISPRGDSLDPQNCHTMPQPPGRLSRMQRG
ncbi:MAG: Ig-like domain-containing protein [Methanoregula sp.]